MRAYPPNTSATLTDALLASRARLSVVAGEVRRDIKGFSAVGQMTHQRRIYVLAKVVTSVREQYVPSLGVGQIA